MNGGDEMREVVGSRQINGFTRKNFFFDENGVFEYDFDFKSGAETYEERLRFKRSMGRVLAGDSEFFVGVTDGFMNQVIKDCIGKTEDEIKGVIGKHVAYREARRADRRSEEEKWNDLREKFSGIVIGVSKDIDIYDSGFSVRVLFRSDVGFNERKKFLVENRTEFVRWVMQELADGRWARKMIGDIRFYKPVEMVNLRIPEVDMKFEIKEREGIA